MKKLIAALLAAVTVFALCSCTISRKTDAADKTTAPAETSVPSYTYDDPVIPTKDFMYIDGVEKVPEWVLSLDGRKIGFSEFRHFYVQTVYNIEYDLSVEEKKTYWNEETETEALNKALAALIVSNASDDYAAKNGFALTEEEIADFNQRLDSTIEQMGEEYMKNYYDEYFQNEESLRLLTLRSMLNQKIFYSFYDAESGTKLWDDAKIDEYVKNSPVYSGNTLAEYAENNFYRCKHVLIKFPDGADDAAKAACLAKAEEVRAKAVAGEDFDALIKDYGEDPGMTHYTEGYTFNSSGYTPSSGGTMVTEFTVGTTSLEIGGISEPILTTYGYHVIKRLPLNEDAINEAKTLILYGSRNFTGAYDDEFQEWFDGVSEAYDPEVVWNEDVKPFIAHDKVF